MGRGSFINHRKGEVSYANLPTKSDMIWIDPVTGVQYSFDNVRNYWLSTSKHEFEFARNGNADGMYLPLMGDLYDVEDAYVLPYNAVITGVWCRSKLGETSKSFDIRINGATAFTFAYDGSGNRLYINNDLNIAVESLDEINIYVSKDGDAAKNTVCKLETSRRFDI